MTKTYKIANKHYSLNKWWLQLIIQRTHYFWAHFTTNQASKNAIYTTIRAQKRKKLAVTFLSVSPRTTNRRNRLMIKTSIVLSRSRMKSELQAPAAFYPNPCKEMQFLSLKSPSCPRPRVSDQSPLQITRGRRTTRSSKTKCSSCGQEEDKIRYVQK